MKLITFSELTEQSNTAARSPRLRAHRNLHPELSDPVQRLAIAMEPGTYVRPHRHPHTFELLIPLRGRFVVLNFDEQGTVTQRTVLGESTAALEIAPGVWHAVLSLDPQGVIFEVKQGAYQPVAVQDYVSWAPEEGGDDVARLIAWYAAAREGDRFSA